MNLGIVCLPRSKMKQGKRRIYKNLKCHPAMHVVKTKDNNNLKCHCHE